MERNRQLPLTETVYYILLAVIEPAHGYLIIQKIDQLSNGQVKMAAGTLYGAIENLMKLQFIQPIASKDSRRKVYEITEKGREILQLDQNRMQHMINVTTSLLNNEEEDNR
ncbi:PadR family transcriptional regulator [Alkalihalobacillus trypoxylicola]|uniref:PadR family transcriptional regulator n=1 Tax=Alkalihalobacillus trypoxylicola TaxID=519424 RepID=A0A162E5C3_9BACI|nr:PadR family transcriptional regulator [Alkalihalobacillus trypoxylicola]KYG31766.1 PadR family transcriptional regulator [Alkalihalobacillus trypoxylicola]